MDETLLQYAKRRVRINRDISHQEYDVIGLDWDNGKVLLSSDNGIIAVDPKDVNLIPEEANNG